VFTKRSATIVGILMSLATGIFALHSVSAQTTRMRWDIISITIDNQGKGIFDQGGVAYATTYDSSEIRLTGSGTFGAEPSDPVNGGGKWQTFDHAETEIGHGTYTVTGLVSWDEAPGTEPAEFVVDKIGANEDFRSGVAILTVAYTNDDGTSSGHGILVLSCTFVGTPASVVEGVAATMGYVSYLRTVPPLTNLDTNHTAFHVLH